MVLLMSRLSPSDWIAAGFRELTASGPTALKAEPLARALGTTKGSFYWHFADVPAFHAAMLTFWEDQATTSLIEQTQDAPTPALKLRKLGDLATQDASEFGGVRVEPAIRAWAFENKSVAHAVARVDTKRMRYLNGLLGDLGLTNPEMAQLLYAALIGLEDLSCRDEALSTQPLGSLIDMMLTLARDD